MGQSTVYDVRINYLTKDQASKGIAAIGTSADRTSSSLGGLKSLLVGLGAGGALYAGKRAFIDYNSSIEQTTISLAAQDSLLRKTPFAQALGDAGGMFKFYRDEAKKSIGETEDFLAMHKMIGTGAIQAGLGMDELRKMTVGATVSALAFGERADVVALDIKQMLAGTVTARDRFANMMLASMGISQEKHNASTAAQRAATTMKAFKDPAIEGARRAMEGSFAGVTSTLKDTLKIAFGEVGLPLFQEITAEIKSWNAWIEKNPDKIREWATDFKSALMSGYRLVKSIASVLLDRKEIIFALAGIKIAGAAATGIGGIFGNFSGFGKLNEEMGKGEKGIGTFIGKVGAAAGALAGLIIAGQALADWYVEERIAKDVAKKDFSFAKEATTRIAGAQLARSGLQILDNLGIDTWEARTKAGMYGQSDMTSMVEKAIEMGVLSRDTLHLNEGAARRMLMKAEYGTATDQIDEALNPFQRIEQSLKASNEFIEALKLAIGDKKLERHLGLGANPPADPKAANELGKGNRPINVTIKQVISDDPDRFVIGLNRIANRAARNPTTTSSATRGAF